MAILKKINKQINLMTHSKEKSGIISRENVKLLKKGVIKEIDRKKGDLFTTVFTMRKRDMACTLF